MSLRRGRTCSSRGFTIIELMVVLAIVGVLLAFALPKFSAAIADTRDRSAMEKFLQDYEWLRGMASRPGVTGATLVLNADCSWTSSLTTSAVPTPTVDAAHSLTAAEINSMRAVLACQGVQNIALPVTFALSSQGFITPNGRVEFWGRSQKWPLQVLFSGSLVRIKGSQ